MTGTLWTLGYAGLHGSDDLRQRLGDHAAIVVDIRLSARSREPAWGHRTRATVEAAGYEYRHVPGLGNVHYRDGGPIQITDPDAVAEVVELLEQGWDRGTRRLSLPAGRAR